MHPVAVIALPALEIVADAIDRNHLVVTVIEDVRRNVPNLMALWASDDDDITPRKLVQTDRSLQSQSQRFVSHGENISRTGGRYPELLLPNVWARVTDQTEFWLGERSMCNLYSNTTAVEAMRGLFNVSPDRTHLGNAEPLTAIYPKGEAPVVRIDNDGERELINLSWGFRTTKKSKKTGNVISPAAWNNARSEKVTTSGLWKHAFHDRRCLIPASSYCEWPPGGNPQVFHWFALMGDEPRPAFAFAGMWQTSRYETKDGPETCETHTMITTSSNSLTGTVHPDRMPVILAPEDYEQWLSGSESAATALLKPFPTELMRIALVGEKHRQDEL